MEESADYLEFDLNGQSLKGWVWRSPFQNGDQVTVAAQSQRDHYEIYGVARPADRTISLYPHCSRSKRRHIRNAVKWWVIFNVMLFGPLSILMLPSHGPEVFLEPGIFWFNVVLTAFFILMFVSLTRQYMPFVRLAQKVFLALELPDAKNIDLVKSSSKQRVISDPPEFGTFYFRY